MIVLSARMQKAGTAWYFNLTNDMLIAGGNDDARAVRTRYRLQRFMTEANCNIGRTSLQKLLAVSWPALLGRSYVLKTHERPTRPAAAMLRLGVLKATYIYRDPRDVVVSIYEHGERLRRENAVSATGFDRLDTYEAAIEFVDQRLPIWRAWTEFPRALLVRYEKLVADPLGECQRLANHLGLDLAHETPDGIVNRYSAARASLDRPPHPLHFNKGVSGRWRETLSSTTSKLCEARFGPYHSAMGYSS